MFVRALIESACSKGILESFHTTIAYRGGHWSEKLLPARVLNRYKRRSYAIKDDLIHRHPFRETVRLLTAKAGLARLNRHESGWASLDEVYKELDRKTAWSLAESEATHLHCYEDGALESFKLAKRLGLRRSYELPIIHWKVLRELLAVEAERRPEWAPTLVATDDSKGKLARKDEEISLADTIVVPSKFVLNSLPDKIRLEKTCLVAPFGTPQTDCHSSQINPHRPDRIRFLFAGSMSQRKGLGDLLEAFSKIDREDAELVIMGTPLMDMKFYREQFDGFTYEPPRSHTKVLELMQSCHVLVLPSIAEGRALVQQEAMSQGMALLATANAGGEDLVIEGQTGFIIPVGDPVSIEDKIHWFADHPEETIIIGQNAQRHASRYTWEKYADLILENLRHLDTQK